MVRKNCYSKKKTAKFKKRLNVLWKTRSYLIGNMQYVDNEEGEGWRDDLTKILIEMGVVVFDPYHKPFIKDVQEGGKRARSRLDRALALQDFDFLGNKMREIRSYDLNLVDRSDFIIAFINPKVASWGTAEELTTAVRAKKPIFLAVKGGKIACPYWIFGMIPHKYIYNSIDEIVKVLRRINTGNKKLDSNRWRLLRKEYR